MEGLSKRTLLSTHRRQHQHRTAQERPEDRDQRGRSKSDQDQLRRCMPNDMSPIIGTVVARRVLADEEMERAAHATDHPP